MSDGARNAEVSDEQAAEALRTLMGEKPEPDTTAEDTPPKAAQAEEETPEDQEEAQPDSETTDEAAAGTDDVETLKASLAERDERLKELETQNESIRSTAGKSLQWAKDLALKKSTESDSLRKYLESLAGRDEIDKAEIQRVLGGQPLQPQQGFQYPSPVQQQPASGDEFTAMDEQIFLLDHPMNQKQYEAFNTFIQTANIPEAFVPGNTYATLSRFHNAFTATKAAESKQKTKAVQSVQRVQRQAQRAAGAISSKGSPSPAPEKAKSFHDMSIEEIENTPGLLSKLFERSMEE